MIADDEFRVWALREAAGIVRGMRTVQEAADHLDLIADGLTVSYIEDATLATEMSGGEGPDE